MDRVVGKDGLLYCKVCGERAEKIIDFPLLDGTGRTERRKVEVMCRCETEAREAREKRAKFEKEQRRIDELRRLSLMDAKLKDIRFSDFQTTEGNANAFDIAKKYVNKFEKMYENSQGLLFFGDVGTGKSYTAAAIANELLDRQVSVIMTSFVKLLKEMEGFGKDDGEYIARLNSAKLLIVDDLGTERGTDYSLEKVYDIIDSRYRSGKPIILTTNIDLAHMKECDDMRYKRIYDRIFEMCYPVKITGMSWRKKEAAKRYENMKKILEG